MIVTRLLLFVLFTFLLKSSAASSHGKKRSHLLKKQRGKPRDKIKLTDRDSFPIYETRLIANICGTDKMPRGWRTSADLDIIRTKAKSSGIAVPSLEGLTELNCSVSGQHCLDERGRNLIRFFRSLIKRGTVDRVVVLDARLEAHGFLDGLAVSWHQRLNNWERIDLPLHHLDADEEAKLDELRRAINTKNGGMGKVVLYDKPKPEFGPFTGERTVRYREVRSEREMWKHVPFVRYFRLHQADHCPPPDRQVDQFLRFIDGLEKDGQGKSKHGKGHTRRRTWFHLHCKGGAGRSTAIASFMDMIFNADRVSFNDILTRQYLLGHSNLLAQQAASDNPEKDVCYKARVDFLRRFHQFCKLRLQYHNTSALWTDYLAWNEKAFWKNSTMIAQHLE